jgi:hypothetical protein
VDPARPTVEVPTDEASLRAKAGRKYVLADYLFQLVTTTAGVLIALFVNGLMDWSGDRALVREARSTIAREIVENKRQLQGMIEQTDARAKDLTNAMHLAEDLIATGQSAVRSVNLGFRLGSLSSTGWRSAERAGALAHMDSSEVL